MTKLVKPRHSLPSDESARRASPSPTASSGDLSISSSNPIAFPSHDRDDESALKLRKPSLLKIVKRNSIRGLRSISFKRHGSESDTSPAASPSKKGSSHLSSIHIPHLRFSSSASHSSQSSQSSELSQSSSSGESLQTAAPLDPAPISLNVDDAQSTRKRRVSLPSFRLLLPKSSSKNLRDSDSRKRTLSYAVPLSLVASAVGRGVSDGPDTPTQQTETALEDVPPGLTVTDVTDPALSIPLPLTPTTPTLPAPSTPSTTLPTPSTPSTPTRFTIPHTPSRISIPPTPKPVPSDDDIDSPSPSSPSESNSDADTESETFDPDCDHLYPYPLALSLLGKPRPTAKPKSTPKATPTPHKKRHNTGTEDEVDIEGPYISHVFIRVPVGSVRLRRSIGFHLVWWLKA
ncbi:hypothetical protein BDP27DRAFT_1400414 [Rhodocollybia butyracea]|uniref:Uncharacterized protein n=1 Tax=Rhodocollybia butyracea TaxID=206335 RepID=A0A9P5UCL3_9AGAR|nr:hypothetical protein BDP27DRAFT_1400414 [Rhodocollybia butyracea]